jgi:hypothetical protein
MQLSCQTRQACCGHLEFFHGAAFSPQRYGCEPVPAGKFRLEAPGEKKPAATMQRVF